MKIQSVLETEMPRHLKLFSFRNSDFTIKANTINLSVFLLYCGCFLVLLFNYGKVTDETIYHYPNVINFYNNGLAAVFNQQYSSANTPLPYIIVAFIGKIFSPGLLMARITTCIISFLSYLLAARLLKKMGSRGYVNLIFLFFPYFFVNSFIFYVINYAIFFLLIGLNILFNDQRSRSWVNNLLLGIFLSMAVLCQQFYLVVPLAIIITRFMFVLKNKDGLNSISINKAILNNVLLIIPLLVPLYIFYRWQGITHPNFHKHSLSFYPSAIVAILFVTGFYNLPFIIQSIRKIKWFENLIALFVASILVYFFRPIFNDMQGPGYFTGIAFHLVSLSGKIFFLLPFIEMILLTWMGILVFWELLRSISTLFEYILYISGLLLALVYSMNTLIGERHLIGLNAILFLLILPRIQRKTRIPYVIMMAVIGICYFVFFFFLKFN